MKMTKEDIARGLGIASHHKSDAGATHAAGNKVLPVNDSTATQPSSSSSSSSTSAAAAAPAPAPSNTDQCTTNIAEKKDKTTKGDKTKTISRMKELLKWAATARAEKGGRYFSRKVLHFRNRAALKAVPDDDQLSNDSPKISFRWDVESCSTTSSAYSVISAISKASSIKHDQKLNANSVSSTPLHVRDESVARPGNWITSDSEFVVLEL